ncbi:MAG: thioesterase [Endomicrobia bacterium]|nr:thioesterase [Endomicrobiia bacterium]
MLEEIFKVRFHEMTTDRSVPVWIVQNYFQQAAAMDAKNLSYGIEELFSNGIAWALIDIKFEILGEIKGVQNVKVKTWHCFSDKIYSRRDFIVYDENGDEKIKGASSWVIIDLAKRKIAKTPQSMLSRRIEPIANMEPAVVKPPPFEGKTPVTSIRIKTRLEDIDINNHVNNIHFTAWAFEGVPETVKQNNSLEEIAVNYKAEAIIGENITVKTYNADNNSFYHILTRDSDGKEIASAYTLWSLSK